MSEQRAEFEVVLKTDNARRDLNELHGTARRGGSGGPGGGSPGGAGGGGGGGGGGTTIVGGGGAMGTLAKAAAAIFAASQVFGKAASDVKDGAAPILERLQQDVSRAIGASDFGADGRAESRARARARQFAMDAHGMASDADVAAVYEHAMQIEGARARGEKQFSRLDSDLFGGTRGIEEEYGSAAMIATRLIGGWFGSQVADRVMRHVNR